ncbi:MAG: YCF48-related protein [Bacteroidota bacterium]
MIRLANALLLLLFFLFVACHKGPEPLGFVEYQLPVPGELSAITQAVNEDLVVVGGATWNEGVIASWNPSIETWSIDTSTERLLLDIFSQPTSGRLYTVGLGGDFLTRGEGAWEFRRLPDWAQFRGGYFFPDGSGWIVSGNAWKNGRLTHLNTQLNRDTFLDFEEELDLVYFLDSLRGFAAGFGLLLETNDQGMSWQRTNLGGDWFLGLQFPEPEIGYLAGYAGSLYKTVDAGETWSELRAGGGIFAPDWRLRAVFFKNAEIGLAVGDEGMIRQTTDGGETWNRITGLPEIDWRDVLWNDGNWWLVGSEATILQLSLPD